MFTIEGEQSKPQGDFSSLGIAMREYPDKQASAVASVKLQIDRHSELSYEQFARQYLYANKPVIITDAIRNWKALCKWTPDFFRARYGSKEVTIDDKRYKVAEFIELVLQSNKDHPAPYLRNQVIARLFPDQLQDIDLHLKYCTPNWLNGRFFRASTNQIMHRCSAAEIYIGGEGASFPCLHFDGMHTHAFINQIFGRKQFIAYSPDQTSNMYPSDQFPNISNVPNVEQPDLTKFPLLANTVPIKFFLEPGETLFIPSGWWHTAKILNPSISVSVNVANSSNWSNVSKDYCDRPRGKKRFLAPTLTAYMAGIRVIRVLSDWAFNDLNKH